MSSPRTAVILSLAIPCVFAAGCRTARRSAADEVSGFRQLLTVADPSPTDTICLGVARGDRVRDAPPDVVAALRTARPAVRPLSACPGRSGGERGRVRLLLTSATTSADTLRVTGADGRGLTYDCRVSRSGIWRGSCVISRAT